MTAAAHLAEKSRFHAFAAMSAGDALRRYRYSPGPSVAEMAITHSGICHSDLHLIDNDWGVSSYPLVPGHEIVGTVTRTGAEVEGVRVGQRVGVGWPAGSCMRCDLCRAGKENFCAQARPACVGRARVPASSLLEGQKSLGGSAVGSNAELLSVLRFSARHAIKPMTEISAMKKVNEVIDRLKQNRVRYRTVLMNESPGGVR